MKITSTPEQLTLRDNPGCIWFLGIFFIGVGLPFIVGPLGLFANNDEVSLTVKVLTMVMGGIAVVVGGSIIYESPLTKVGFDRLKGEVVLRQRGFFNNSTHRYPFTEIESVEITEKEDSDGDPIYQPYLTLRNQQTIPLSSLWMHDKEGSEKVVIAVQNLLDQKKE